MICRALAGPEDRPKKMTAKEIKRDFEVKANGRGYVDIVEIGNWLKFEIVENWTDFARDLIEFGCAKCCT